MSRFIAIAVVTLLLSAFSREADAQGRGSPAPAKLVNPNDPYCNHIQGVVSWRLGGRFHMQQIQASGHIFVAAKLTENPQSGSPLQQIGLRAGDVIVRLDGDRITQFDHLNGHIRETSVRFIRMSRNPNAFEEGEIYIDEHMLFGDSGHHSHRPPMGGNGSNGP